MPSASLRQSNCYFSSSDAAFSDRYEAELDYDRVTAGSVAVDGGWRIYSSGPGIAISLVVSSFLGMRRGKSVLILDPVIPPMLDGLRARLPINEHSVEVLYRAGATGCGPVWLELNGSELPFTRGVNPYRAGAAEVSMAVMKPRLAVDGNLLVIHLG